MLNIPSLLTGIVKLIFPPPTPIVATIVPIAVLPSSIFQVLELLNTAQLKLGLITSTVSVEVVVLLLEVSVAVTVNECDVADP